MSRVRVIGMAMLIFVFIAIPLAFLSQNISSITTVDPALKRQVPDITSTTARRGFPMPYKTSASGYYGLGSTRIEVFNNEISSITHTESGSFSRSTVYDLGYFALDVLIYFAVFMVAFTIIEKRRNWSKYQK